VIPYRELLAVVRVFVKGAWKHREIGGWKRSPKNYRSALVRHWGQFEWADEQRDPESGEHPLAHVAANALILMWRERNR
jgi:hypothetical protein